MMVLVQTHSYESVPLAATVVVVTKFHVHLDVMVHLKKIHVLVAMDLVLVDFIVDQGRQMQQQRHVHLWM